MCVALILTGKWRINIRTRFPSYSSPRLAAEAIPLLCASARRLLGSVRARRSDVVTLSRANHFVQFSCWYYPSTSVVPYLYGSWTALRPTFRGGVRFTTCPRQVGSASREPFCPASAEYLGKSVPAGPYQNDCTCSQHITVYAKT